MMVLRFQQTEDQVDQRFFQTAIDLGINLPQDPTTTLDLITSDVAALHFPPSPSQSLQTRPSRASQSTHTASDSSIDQQPHRKTPSLAATSITTASMSSASSTESNYIKVRQGFRRISRLHRRKNMAMHVTSGPLPAQSILQVSKPGLEPRKTTTDQVPSISHPHPHAITTIQTQTLQMPQQQVMSVAYNALPSPPQPTISPPSSPEDETLDFLGGRCRSISNPMLKKLRTTQLQEQLRFISFEASQYRVMRTKQRQHKRNALSQYHQQKNDTQTRHAEALSSLEHRHLSAEVDLHRALELERQACDTRLKHMQAYCNPFSTIEGMPSRVVTKRDCRQLEQQQHIRNGMDNLHTSRINVLREKQAKQYERIVAKQETELENLESGFKGQSEEMDIRFRADETQLQEKFSARKNRLVSRWTLVEAIERRKMDLATGEVFGPLPPIIWTRDLATGEEEEKA